MLESAAVYKKSLESLLKESVYAGFLNGIKGLRGAFGARVSIFWGEGLPSRKRGGEMDFLCAVRAMPSVAVWRHAGNWGEGFEKI